LNYDQWDGYGNCNYLGYYEPYNFSGYGDDLKPRNNTMAIDPVPPQKLVTRGTVLVGRRFRPNQRRYREPKTRREAERVG
jgi:hypothetical protein